MAGLWLCVVCVLVCFSLSGCDRIKSRFESLLHSKKSAKPHAKIPARPVVVGPELAIILDDVGGDDGASDAIFALHYPLTLSVLPNHPRSSEIANQAHAHGYAVMLHLPMESLANESAEKQELRPGMSPEQIANTLDDMLRTVPYAAGVNNHQGSRATSDRALMQELMPQLHRRELFFVDSRTTAATVAYEAAKAAGVPCASRNAPFLDDVQQESAVLRQLEIAVKDAKEKGYAITIGHPHRATLQALREFLPRVEAQGVHLALASELVR